MEVMRCHKLIQIALNGFFLFRFYSKTFCLICVYMSIPHLCVCVFLRVQTITMNKSQTLQNISNIGLLWIIFSFLIAIWVLYFFLYKFFFLLPTVWPATIDLGRSTIGFSGTIIYIILSDVPCFFIKFIFMYESTFFFTCLFWICPWLFLSRCKYAIEYDSSIMDQGSNKEDILPLLTCLWKEDCNFRIAIYKG